MSPSEIQNSFSALRQFARKSRPAEHCELCGAELAQGHPHLTDPQTRKLFCACGACAILFSAPGRLKYKRVPDRVRFLSPFHLTGAQWEGLMIPINMAFFFESSPDARVVAIYPGPAGATESLLPLETWSDIVEENPVLRGMEPDVEALLVNRLGPARGYRDAQYYLLPIDECYKLVGLIRAKWRGLSGGSEVWQELERFFAGLQERSGAASGGLHA